MISATLNVGMNTITLFDPDLVRQAISVLVEPGAVFEIRALQATTPEWRNRPRTISGFFDNSEDVVEELPRLLTAKGIYITLNPVIPDLLAVRKNRLGDAKNGEGTADGQIVKRRRLLIDTDPMRPSSHISSTDDELEAAVERAYKISDYLESLGFPKPLCAISGNGGHLLYRVDLPADDGGVVQQCLIVLAQKFDDHSVKVDRAVFNPARISKLYGTLVCKGDGTNERPHRFSAILELPERFEVVNRDLFENLAQQYKRPRPGFQGASTARANSGYHENQFDLREFLKKHHVAVKREVKKNRQTIIELEHCPFNTDHGNHGEATVFIRDNGIIGFKCHHNSCSGRGWREFRKHFEPNYDGSHHGNNSTDHKTSKEQVVDLIVTDASDLFYEQIDEPRWVVEHFICEGITLLGGKPKIGKSWLALALALGIVKGGTILEHFNAKKGEVLLLALEDNKARLQKRLKILCGDCPPPGLRMVTATEDFPRLDRGGIELLQKHVQQHPATTCIIIDTLQKVKPIGVGNRNAYENDTDALSALHQFALSNHVGVVLIHHLRKSMAEDVFDELSGSLGLSGVADTNVVIKKGRGEKTATMHITGRAIEEYGEFAMTFDSSTAQWRILGSADEVNLGETRKAIISAMELSGKNALTLREIDDEFRLAGVEITDANLRRTIGRMVKDGQLIRTGDRYRTLNQPDMKDDGRDREPVV